MLERSDERAVFHCIANCELFCKHPERIRQAAKLGADAMREIQRLHKLLECWEVME